MLAQHFKTPQQLAIPQTNFDALVKVLGMLEREEIPADKFTMRVVGNPECGAPGCIKGWAESIGYNDDASALSAITGLFFPMDIYCYSATGAQAATALRSYLTTGDPNWREAMR